MLYAGYYNLSQADNASRRASANSTASSTKEETPNTSRRSSIKKLLDQLKPIEKPVTPAGIYSPMIAKGPLFTRRKSEEWKKMSRYEKNAAVAAWAH